MKIRYKKYRIKKDKKLEKLELFKPILNWIIFVLVMSISLFLLVYSLNGEFEDVNFQVLFIVLGIFSLIYGFKIDNGTSYLSDWYSLFTKNKFIIEFFPTIPFILFLICYVLLLAGYVTFTFLLLQLSMITFSFPLIFGMMVRAFPFIKMFYDGRKRNKK